MSKIRIADEFFSAENVTKYMEKNKISCIQETVVILGREFAKLHVKEALKVALEDAPTGSSTDIPSYEEMEDAILNAYPLENIK